MWLFSCWLLSKKNHFQKHKMEIVKRIENENGENIVKKTIPKRKKGIEKKKVTKKNDKLVHPSLECDYGDQLDRTEYVHSFLSFSFFLSLSFRSNCSNRDSHSIRHMGTYLRTGLDSAIGVATPNALIRCCMVGVADVIRMVPCCVKFGPLIIWSGDIASGLYPRDTSSPLLLSLLLFTLILTTKEFCTTVVSVRTYHVWMERQNVTRHIVIMKEKNRFWLQREREWCDWFVFWFLLQVMFVVVYVSTVANKVSSWIITK